MNQSKLTNREGEMKNGKSIITILIDIVAKKKIKHIMKADMMNEGQKNAGKKREKKKEGQKKEDIKDASKKKGNDRQRKIIIINK